MQSITHCNRPAWSGGEDYEMSKKYKYKYKIKSKRILPDGRVVNVLKIGRDMFMLPEDAELFIKAAYKYNLHWGFFFELMYQGFYRPMELISLEVGNFHFRTDTVYMFPMKEDIVSRNFIKYALMKRSARRFLITHRLREQR